MSKQTGSKTIEKIKLKDIVDCVNESDLIDANVENPISKLHFQVIRKRRKNKNHLWMFVLVFILITSSILFNSTLRETIEPKLFNMVSAASASDSFGDFISAQFTKPYVVTIGEYGNFSIAKDEAIKILPLLRQIDIKQLQTGIYTFEIKRHSSKQEAYSLANKFMQDGFDAVHVRYLPN